MKKLFLVVLFIFAFVMLQESYAQVKRGPGPQPVSATINARATVLAPISIGSTRDLDFGDDILPGIPKVIDKTSNTSGKFSILGQNGKEVSILMATPQELLNGENTLTIYFSPSDAAFQLPGGTMIEFDPMSEFNASFGTEGSMDIYLGGTVVPTYTQTGGLYEGTVTVQFYYTGN
jgi:hypothetical protein